MEFRGIAKRLYEILTNNSFLLCLEQNLNACWKNKTTQAPWLSVSCT